ncbi:hypothetical protein CCHL11_07891 [Colletotrichum chlorophyti]|uniref:Uncharacterized protein n=1 Tax=Colletotrichum chlorophyti TaxID=708187 RepID=A0A1Q8RR62_9PEZI|nr:hypothetical protein CCHL11_07891 [Colletotrichum chlorophyti]
MKLFPLILVAGVWVEPVDPKAVFAHLMVGNMEHYTEADLSREISLAQEAHIYGSALSFAHSDCGFQLFFCFDYAGNGSCPQDDVIALIQKYSSQPSYFLHEGSKPLVSTFEGPKAADDWQLIKEQTNCFFMPSWSFTWGEEGPPSWCS